MEVYIQRVLNVRHQYLKMTGSFYNIIQYYAGVLELIINNNVIKGVTQRKLSSFSHIQLHLRLKSSFLKPEKFSSLQGRYIVSVRGDSNRSTRECYY